MAIIEKEIIAMTLMRDEIERSIMVRGFGMNPKFNGLYKTFQEAAKHSNQEVRRWAILIKNIGEGRSNCRQL